MDLGRATWPEIAATQSGCVLAVPLGSLEQHGPHLPLDTDTRIAVELAGGWRGRDPDVVVAPGGLRSQRGARRIPGTLLINHAVLADLLVELVRSARCSFAGVVLISAHGGNHEGLSMVGERCRADGDAGADLDRGPPTAK
jgi:creatinine amidohydrolase/Fe(II)-dependent formamide hydrolase-like protein